MMNNHEEPTCGCGDFDDEPSYCNDCRFVEGVCQFTGEVLEEGVPKTMEFYEKMRQIANEYEQTGKWNINLLLDINKASEATNTTAWESFKGQLKEQLTTANMSLSRVYDDHGHYDDAQCCEECVYWSKEMIKHH